MPDEDLDVAKLADDVAAYHRELLRKGFKRDEAIMLANTYQEFLLVQRTGGEDGAAAAG